MKNIGLIIIVIIFILSCDKVEKPYAEEGVWISTGKKVLIEEFTGFKCGNCPSAHEIIKTLSEKYGDQVIPVAIHVGWYADTIVSGDPNFKTGIGDTLNNKFKAEDNGLPVGMINRFKTDNNYLISPGSWASVIDSALRSYPKANIIIENQYDTVTRVLTTTISTEVLQKLNGEIYLVAYILEDSIVGKQLTYTPSNEWIPDYMHRHVLRGHINGIWGEKVAEGETPIGNTFEKQYTSTLDDDWNQKKCHIVAYIYIRETLEIIQAETKYVIE
ncbi:MAG: Omp28 family outer membrane lipoprotein [Bacteroidota bacterium]